MQLSCHVPIGTINKLCGRPQQCPPANLQYLLPNFNSAPAPVTLTFDLLTLKVVFESRVTWATSVPNVVFLGLSVLDLGLMYAIDVSRQTDIRQHHRLMPLPRGGGTIMPENDRLYCGGNSHVCSVL